MPSNQASDTIKISRYIQAPEISSGKFDGRGTERLIEQREIDMPMFVCLDAGSPGSVGILDAVQDGTELNIVCELKEKMDDLEQKHKLGFIWDDASELERLLAVRNVLDGMVVNAGCIIGTTSEKHCLEIKVCKEVVFLE